MPDRAWRDEIPEHIERPARDGQPYRDVGTGGRLWPLFHTCGAVALWSRVPPRSGQRVPAPEHLVLADGLTPLWTPIRGRLLGRLKPAAPDCPSCGETVNKALRTKPLEN